MKIDLQLDKEDLRTSINQVLSMPNAARENFYKSDEGQQILAFIHEKGQQFSNFSKAKKSTILTHDHIRSFHKQVLKRLGAKETDSKEGFHKDNINPYRATYFKHKGEDFKLKTSANGSKLDHSACHMPDPEIEGNSVLISGTGTPEDYAHSFDMHAHKRSVGLIKAVSGTPQYATWKIAHSTIVNSRKGRPSYSVGDKDFLVVHTKHSTGHLAGMGQGFEHTPADTFASTVKEHGDKGSHYHLFEHSKGEKAVRHIGSFKDATAAHTQAHNAALLHLSSLKKDSPVLAKGIELEAQSLKPSDPEGRNWTTEDIEKVTKKINKMPPEDRELSLQILPGPVVEIVLAKLKALSKSFKKSYKAGKYGKSYSKEDLINKPALSVARSKADTHYATAVDAATQGGKKAASYALAMKIMKQMKPKDDTKKQDREFSEASIASKD